MSGATPLGGRRSLLSRHVERGDGSDGTADDSIYPSAPLPAHERAWRHPSELGHADWVASEPPLAVGRGVLVATGAIGSVLGLAVLWMLVPAGLPTPPAAAPTVSQSMQASAGTEPTRSPGSAPPTAAPPPTSSLRSTTTVTPARIPPNTLEVVRNDSDGSRPAPSAAIAVVVQGTTMLITTAAAIDGGVAGDPITLHASGDEAHLATVAHTMGEMVVLESVTDSPDTLGATAFTTVATAAPDQAVLVLTAEPIEVPFSTDGAPLDLTAIGDAADDVAEGTPVIDESGALVALCTRRIGAQGDLEITLVPVAELLLDIATAASAEPADTTTTTPDTGTTAPSGTEPAAWLGVVLGPDEARPGAVVVTVVPDSPADLAGLAAGSRITRVDGIAVTGHESLLSVVHGAAPGQTLELTVAVAGEGGAETIRTLSVLLAAAAPSA